MIGVIITIAVVWILFRAFNQRTGRKNTAEKTPLDILKERFARGDISKQEYEEKKKDLQ
ncbi:MAG: SHOCT domain-containing protein [Cyclobacteriaceae bacterium]|nr:SHOCT domain-containing protein [Cyclobacteriaceae bacterium]